MSERWFQGRHPILGIYGVWLSKPGIDVRSAYLPEHFILSPTVKFEQVVLAGQVYLQPGGTILLPYPYNFTRKPYVWLKSSVDYNITYYPYWYLMDTQTGAQLNPRYVTCGVFQDRLVLQNPNEYQAYVTYMVFFRQSGL